MVLIGSCKLSWFPSFLSWGTGELVSFWLSRERVQPAPDGRLTDSLTATVTNDEQGFSLLCPWTGSRFWLDSTQLILYLKGKLSDSLKPESFLHVAFWFTAEVRGTVEASVRLVSELFTIESDQHLIVGADADIDILAIIHFKGLTFFSAL